MGLHEDRVVWVTGAASGIGRATVEEIVSEGGRVVATDLAAADMGWADGQDSIVTMVADAASEADNEAAAALAVRQWGRLDGVLLNAGISMGGDVLHMPMEQFDRVMDINVRGVVLGVRAAARVMGPGSAIVAIGSTSGIGGDTGRWPYNASKGAVVNLVRGLSIDLGARGIRVNAVCPGPTITGMTARLQETPEVFESLRTRISLGRWGTAAELAAVTSFLLSTKASFVNGAIVPVDGGVTANTGQFAPPPPSYDI